ncbi:helix-turn-helix domain-containing protein [Alkalihalobacillus trypoxylicola]|uniref:HTH araC/xylS-type domain-containing protein n=1 Tax=Alkalihalobacillus trypoxylicola TaxID=519424 RepID=A0A162CX71_9BACI|nr:helix-turn-helix domain-containing protein [Alkalihalobacillus trypoxylicola]KYG26999.1 hypothetical protein AZF04_11735 [Alkalihalobacillus trypoxylicola]
MAFMNDFSARSSLPFSIYYDQTKNVQHELPEHSHDWLEIIWIHSGSGSIFIDQTFYEIKKNVLILIPSNTIHRTLPNSLDPLTSTVLYFSPAMLHLSNYTFDHRFLNIFKQSKTHQQYLYILETDAVKKFAHFLENLNSEYILESSDRIQGMLLWLQLILLHLKRHCQLSHHDSLAASFHTPKPSWLKDSVIYISQHLDSPLSLESLSTIFSVSKAHFSRVFKQQIGMNVTDFITTKRILYAKELLKNDDETISIIAEKCGFTSLPHFYRTFKKHTKMTPSQYRKIEM